MHAIHARPFQPFEFLGRRHIRQHHEFFNQPVAIQARPRRDFLHLALIVQHHFALRQIQIQGAAPYARGQ